MSAIQTLIPVVPTGAWAVRDLCQANGAPRPVAKSAEDAGPWEPYVQQIVQFQHLGDDWDGAGAKSPADELLISAIALANVFGIQGVPPPSRVVPGLDGTVLFEWQLPDGVHAEVEVVRPFFAEVMLIEPGQPARHWTLPTE